MSKLTNDPTTIVTEALSKKETTQFKKGDKVSIINPQRFDAVHKGPANGTIEYITKDGYINVKVGNGAFTVKAKDLKLQESKPRKKEALSDK